jgi:hypothetical protein
MVRRLKSDFRGVTDAFPERKVEQVDIDGLPADAPELRLAELLAEYQTTRSQLVADLKKSKQAAAALVTTHLQQRLLSSVEAFARSLAVHVRSIEKAAAAEPSTAALGRLGGLLTPAGADDDRGLADEKQEEAELEAALGEASAFAAPAEEAASALRQTEARLLKQMSDLAEKARHEPDARVRKLVDWIKANLCPADKWNRRRVLIFTEWTDTLRYLETQLTGHFDEKRIDKFHGALSEDSREALKERFNADPDREPLRILLATDAAREGLNLQNHCADLFHFDVPWNPARLEQRNGRIDRVLQREKKVFCRYFFYAQRPEDRVLQALVRKTETIEKQLGSLSVVLEKRLEKLMTAGIQRDKADLQRNEIEAVGPDPDRKAEVEEELESGRQREEQLREQTDHLRTLLDKSRNAIRFNEKAFRETLSCALDVLGAEKLKPSGDAKGRATYVFPALDERAGADPSWSAAMDLLRAPMPRGLKPHEWRRKFPPRPIVFKDTGSLDNDVVHLHLEHRVVQRLLTRFRAQGFVHDDLSRACVLETSETKPRVVLLGRVCVYGDGASRLHEELIAVSAELEKGETKLKVLSAAEQDESLRLLNTALGNEKQKAVPSVVQERLKTLSTDHILNLRPTLESRGEAAVSRAEKDLAKRGAKEAKDMEVLIREQRKRIEREIKGNEKKRQMVLDFDENEKRQLEADRKHWNKRLVELDDEAEREPKRIRGIYEVRASRIEPVGLVYLWPGTA